MKTIPKSAEHHRAKISLNGDATRSLKRIGKALAKIPAAELRRSFQATVRTLKRIKSERELLIEAAPAAKRAALRKAFDTTDRIALRRLLKSHSCGPVLSIATAPNTRAPLRQIESALPSTSSAHRKTATASRKSQKGSRS